MEEEIGISYHIILFKSPRNTLINSARLIRGFLYDNRDDLINSVSLIEVFYNDSIQAAF